MRAPGSLFRSEIMATVDAVTTIAEALKETDEIPRKQIAEIIGVLGPDVALELLTETRRVQDAGGVEVRDGTRRRTDGGVFFSLAKARLPKADRNRIFRIRPPRSEGSDAPPSDSPVAVAKTPRPAPAPAPPVDDNRAAGAGRRRVVEVEVLRHHAKPPAPRPVIESLPVPVAPAPRPEPRPVPEERPIRRIVTVATPVREEPPATPEAARDRVRALIKGFSANDQRRLLEELLHELGGAMRPGRAPAPAPAAPPKGTVDDKLREQVLASVTEALGLTSGDLARALYGEENQTARSKARVALERWRRTRDG